MSARVWLLARTLASLVALLSVWLLARALASLVALLSVWPAAVLSTEVPLTLASLSVSVCG